MIASLNPDSFNPFMDDDSNSILDDFVFSNTDTIGALLSLNYQQDQEITFYHNSTQKMEEQNQKQRTNQNPLINDPNPNKGDEETLMVKHMVDLKGIRFLYTQKTVDLIIYHLVNGFNYAKLRKTDFIDVEQLHKEYQNEQEANIKGKKQKKKSSRFDFSNSQNKSDGNIQQINIKQLKRTPLIGLRLEDPQFNFQNELTKSQMLITTARPTTAVIFGYSKNHLQSAYHQQNVQHHRMGSDELIRTESGYQIKFHEQVIRYDLQIQVVEMDVFVAPTVINLENPTFWITNLGQVQINTNLEINKEYSFGNNNKGFQQSADKDYYKSENLLRKIITVHNISFTFDFLQQQFVDSLNPQLSIDILLEKLEIEMNGPNMWHFVNVLKAILFERGFKTDEILIHEFDQQFAQVVVSKVSGTHLIYQNREGKTDVDIDKILIENFSDSESYRMVLFPSNSPSPQEVNGQTAFINPETMMKIRTRDKFIVINEAPWQVFDQFEVLLFPTSLRFTKNFYDQFKTFFFADMPNTNGDEEDRNKQEIKKYEMLVHTKALKRAQEKFKGNKKEEDLSPINNQQESKGNLAQLRSLTIDLFRRQRFIQNEQDDRDDDIFEQTNTKAKKSISSTQQQPQFPVFFRYMRMNEIAVSISYFHNKNSFLNSKDLKIKINPFIKHGKFVTFKRIFEKYMHHCRKNFISQIPSLIKQKFLQTKETLRGSKGGGGEDLDDDDDEQQEIKKEIKLYNARKILFGEFYD